MNTLIQLNLFEASKYLGTYYVSTTHMNMQLSHSDTTVPLGAQSAKK